MSNPVSFTAELDKEKVKRLKASAEQAREMLKNAQPTMRRVSVFLDRFVQMNFREEGKPVGGWEPFKAGGRLKKGVFDETAKLLQDTGALRLSFRPFAEKHNAGIGSELPYSKTHEEGDGVPARRMLPKDEEVQGDIRDILSEHVQGITDVIRDAFK